MAPKPTQGRGFTAGGRKGTTKRGSSGSSGFGDYGSNATYQGSASAATGASRVNQSSFMDVAKGPGFGAGRRGKGGAHSSASAVGQRPPRPKEGRRPNVGGSNR